MYSGFAPTRAPRLDDSQSDGREPWDLPIRPQDRRTLEMRYTGRPARPYDHSQVPPAALGALQDVCGPLPLDRLFVIPPSVRPVGHGECVIAPGRVLAFGEESVAVWVDAGGQGHLETSPIAELAAIEDRTVLLYGRLRLIGNHTTVAIRYNTSARADLRDNLAWLRARMATESRPVDWRFVLVDARHRSDDVNALPYRWRFLLDHPSIRLDPAEPAMAAAGDLTEIAVGGNRPPGGIAVLGAREFVLATEPGDWSGPDRHGVDRVIVPRHHLGGLQWGAGTLTVSLVGVDPERWARVQVPLEPYLAQAMWEAFGGEVPWV